ncbi:MAG: hypothetical protein EOM03_14240 [Clostridia bacterium]|nr:hypothetical protein [Clostridia bacterium]
MYKQYVQVKNSKYAKVPVGEIGYIEKIYDRDHGNTCAVRFEKLFNPYSKTGLFYFARNDLKDVYDTDSTPTTKIKKGEKVMDGNYRIATVRFLEGSNTETDYFYACYSDYLAAGDICVVKSAHHGFGIAQITGFVDEAPEEITREIVCGANFSAYEKREADRARRKELMAQMKKRAAELQEVVLYETLAKSDPDMAKLLDELKHIG